eukprot:g2774.t1
MDVANFNCTSKIYEILRASAYLAGHHIGELGKIYGATRRFWMIGRAEAADDAFGQESVEGLSTLMALGYLNLSGNPFPLEALRPLAHAHILELFLGSARSGEERRRALALLPNVWVLDDEYVTARERRAAEDDYSHGAQDWNGHLLRTWNESTLPRSPEKLGDGGGTGNRDVDSRDGVRASQQPSQPKKGPGGGPGFGSLETQGRQVREFYDDVVWKLPSRTDAADTFRLATLLERYDNRTAAANTSAWLGTFTSRGVGGGARGCVRRDWSVPAPRPHLEALMSLPLELKLDVAVLLAVRAALWNSIPQQVLEEAFMVLLVLQGGLSGSIHTDLSRVPAFICTALVHMLRSSILRRLDQDSMPGHSDTTAPPLLDRQQTDLLEAIPPVVTGVDVDGVFEGWQRSSLRMKDPAIRREGGQDTVGNPRNSDQEGGTAVEDLRDVGDRDVLAGVDLNAARNASAAEGVVETHLPAVTADLDGGASIDTPPTHSSVEEENTAARRTAVGAAVGAAGSTTGEGMEDVRSDGGLETPVTIEPPRAKDGSAAAVAEAVDTAPGCPEAYTPLRGVGLTRLCRRGVILLTRSPACPDLVAWQTHPAEQRTYDQMEPLLVRANMTHKDLHPSLHVGHDVRGDSRKVEPARSLLMSSRQWSPSTPSLELDPYPTAGETGEQRGVANTHQPRDALQSSQDGFWSAKIRRPKAGERVQVLHDTWSVIITVRPETFAVLLAPFEGIQLPPYRGDSCVDSRDLCYDPRGWWRHAPALITKPPTGPGRLHRLARGISATGLPWGAGSLNEHLAEGNVIERPCSEGGREKAETAAREKRAPALAPRKAASTASAAFKPSVAAPYNPSIAPAPLRQGVRPKNNVIGVFSAEGSWDPVFVMAPPRLVGLQNQTDARKRGRRRARQTAWRRIDRPEASLAPRPMMPRCASLPAPAETSPDTHYRFLKRSNSILGLPDMSPRLATVAPSHGGSGSGYVWPALSRSLSAPSTNTPCSRSAAAAEEEEGDQNAAVSGDDAWLELQREMGSLRADNRMFLRGSQGGRGGGRGNSKSSPLRASGSASSVLSKSLAEISTVCAEAATDLLAKTLSLGLDSPKPAWKGGKPENKPTAVFELTQVDGEPHRSAGSSTIATSVSSLRGRKPKAETPLVETHQSSTAGSKRGAEGAVERGDISRPPENVKPPRSQGQALRDADSAAAAAAAVATAASRIWKPNVHRPLEWFPVPGRQVLLVDPSDVKAAATVAGVASKTATAGVAGRSAGEPRSSSGVDLRPRDKGAVGGDLGGGNNGDNQGWGGEDRPGHHRKRGRKGPRDEEAEQREDGGKKKQAAVAGGGGANTRKAEAGHEHATQENCDRSEIVLSARSTLLPSSAPVGDPSCCSPAPTDARAGARATARARYLLERCRARPHTSASRAWGRHKVDAAPGGVTARKPVTATDLMVSPSQTNARVGHIGGNRRKPEACHRETACATMSALGRGAFVGPPVTPESTRIMPFSPHERRGEMTGGGSGGRVGVCKSSPSQQRRAEPAVIASPTNKDGGLQVQRIPVRATATASRASSTARKEAAAAPGPPRGKSRHPSRGVPHSPQQRAAISGWEGEETSVVKPQGRGTTSGGLGKARGLEGANMLPTTLHSDNASSADTFSVGSAHDSTSSYCGWNKPSNPILGNW